MWGAGFRRPEIIRADIRRSARKELPLASTRTPEAEPLLTPAEVATMFRVDPKTVTRWAKAGKLTSIRTLGGHRRYRETEVRALLGGIPQQRESD
jgi:excisionase family DNA binding protein